MWEGVSRVETDRLLASPSGKLTFGKPSQGSSVGSASARRDSNANGSNYSNANGSNGSPKATGAIAAFMAKTELRRGSTASVARCVSSFGFIRCRGVSWAIERFSSI